MGVGEKMKKSNNFIYDVQGGTVRGYFKIYQAKNGSIQLIMGNRNITLAGSQVDRLKIDLYDLEDFDQDIYLKYYTGGR